MSHRSPKSSSKATYSSDFPTQERNYSLSIIRRRLSLHFFPSFTLLSFPMGSGIHQSNFIIAQVIHHIIHDGTVRKISSKMGTCSDRILSHSSIIVMNIQTESVIIEPHCDFILISFEESIHLWFIHFWLNDNVRAD